MSAWVLDTEAVITRTDAGLQCQWWGDGCRGEARYAVTNVQTPDIPLVIAECCELHLARAVREILGPDA